MNRLFNFLASDRFEDIMEHVCEIAAVLFTGYVLFQAFRWWLS